MRTGRVVALIIGCLLILPGVGMLLAGGGLGIAYATAEDDGYLSTSIEGVRSDGVAVTTEGMVLVVEPGTPKWLLEWAEVDLRLEATSGSESPIFVGLAPEADVDAYLAGTAHSEVVAVDRRTATVRQVDGDIALDPPVDQTFWTAATTGPGTQQLDWQAAPGRWAVVLMNADASPVVAADVSVGVDAGFLPGVMVILLVLGVVITAAAVTLIVVGAKDGFAGAPRDDGVGWPPPPAADVGSTAGPHTPAATTSRRGTPVSLTARLDPQLSRWQWLVKWFLAIPHYVILGFLWLAFVLLTMVAGVSILFTGSYPRAIFDFNVGVLRWTWRVSYYAASGGLGTDRYPPFSTAEEPDYPATLEVAYPGELSRGLVLVKWWLLAIPHYIIIGLLAGGGYRWVTEDGVRVDPTGGGGILAVLVLIAGLVLLITGRYPRALFDIVVGFNRWIYRVIAYAALMTDEYPPFRLDQGGEEPGATPSISPPPGPTGGTEREQALVGPKVWS